MRADRSLVPVIENQFHPPAYDIQELVPVRMHFATMRRISIEVGDRSDGVAVDSSGRARWSGHDGYCPIVTDVRYVPFKS